MTVTTILAPTKPDAHGTPVTVLELRQVPTSRSSPSTASGSDPVAERIAIRVLGIPIPQGSKVANFHAPGVRDSNDKKLRPWRRNVRDTAKDTCHYHDTLTGPVRVWLRFTFTRPPSHYRSGRNAHLVRDGAPTFPGNKHGDIDKLTRAIFDALTDAGVWKDDTQVVDVRARKFYAGEDEYALDRPGVDIVVEGLDVDVPLTSASVSELHGEGSDGTGAGTRREAVS